MSRRRDKPDGLPFRVYERRGKRVYSIGYKNANGTWAYRLQCPMAAPLRISELRREAIERALRLQGAPEAERTFGWLCDQWLDYQVGLSPSDGRKRKKSTLDENRREIATLKKVFGGVRLSDITHSHGVRYLDACSSALDPAGNPRPRIEKGNKEVILAKAIFGFGMDHDLISANPWTAVKKLLVVKSEPRYVSDKELEILLRAGRAMGGPYRIMALCFQAAFLCYRRSVEARSLTRDMLRDDGILWTSGKERATSQPKKVLIAWSPGLRACIDEALACQRYRGIGTFYVFGNMSGKKYTRHGWGANLRRLMAQAQQLAAQDGVKFEKFSLQECRPKAVSDTLDQNDYDVKAVMNATMHTSQRMIEKTYDRKRVRRAKPVSRTSDES